MKSNTLSLVFFALLTYFASTLGVEAVVPAPDGGYPGGNTAEGQNALLSLTSGGYNTAVGYFSLLRNTTGSFNTALGAGALLANVGDPSTGDGTQNTAIGAAALLSAATGQQNTAVGATALLNDRTGNYNTATGTAALFSNATGHDNTANGYQALFSNIAGTGNTAVGNGALVAQTSGDFNVGVGLFAGNGITTATNVICIGASGADVNDSCYIGNIWTQPGGSQAVYVNSDGKLGAQVSSVRFKKDIKPMDKTSEALLALKPVSFRYKKEIDSAGTSQFGLLAEDVDKVNPDLVIHDKEGKPYSVRYEQVNAMLLNEFLKEHRKVEEQEAAISRLNATVARQEATGAEQEKEIQALSAGLQRVSAQVELNKAAPQTVKNTD